MYIGIVSFIGLVLVFCIAFPCVLLPGQPLTVGFRECRFSVYSPSCSHICDSVNYLVLAKRPLTVPCVYVCACVCMHVCMCTYIIYMYVMQERFGGLVLSHRDAHGSPQQHSKTSPKHTSNHHRRKNIDRHPNTTFEALLANSRPRVHVHRVRPVRCSA